MDLHEVSEQSLAIRRQYRKLERQLHGKEWTTEEDALAFLTDAGLVGRLTMGKEGRWPSEDEVMLGPKIGECVWWLAVLAERNGIGFEATVEDFLRTRAAELQNS
ncbi:hypothetical protein [uncultured Mitsuokella sp.]|uniref:hypothetical protein n=1 Tax=uncultured Mitsuokella sp. TaxID=453120 RepID=UPI0026255535|nr:hypothetical protein [uncultured Mitsuokella sp.]